MYGCMFVNALFCMLIWDVCSMVNTNTRHVYSARTASWYGCFRWVVYPVAFAGTSFFAGEAMKLLPSAEMVL
uniref:Secreted protein n=1 Tax=Anopheles darlingi TaxID=43151 RepID=A0A2M4D855_ANODA